MTAAEIAALLMGVAALGTMLAARYRSRVDQVPGLLAAISNLRKELEECHDSQDDSAHLMDDLRDRLDAKIRELAKAIARIVQLESAMTMDAMAATLDRDVEALRHVLDKIRGNGIVLTSSQDGARLIYANRYFCESLGYTEKELLAIPWQELIHPDDLPRAESAELGAHFDRGEFAGRYKHRDGQWIRMRWFFTEYGKKKTNAFCVVWPERRRGDVPHR